MLAPWRGVVHKYGATIIRITQCRDIQFLEQLCLISRVTSPSQTMRAPLTHIAKTKITKLEKIKSSLTSWHCVIVCPQYLVMLDTLVTPPFGIEQVMNSPHNGHALQSPGESLVETWGLVESNILFRCKFPSFRTTHFPRFSESFQIKNVHVCTYLYGGNDKKICFMEPEIYKVDVKAGYSGWAKLSLGGQKTPLWNNVTKKMRN